MEKVSFYEVKASSDEGGVDGHFLHDLVERHRGPEPDDLPFDLRVSESRVTHSVNPEEFTYVNKKKMI